ncbi:hypothetical protein LWS69_02210 [Bordetella hinzii]|nr:hypothetical protein [Bordetella hinzii]
MTTRHTPGPWEVAYQDSNGQSVIKAEHIEVATCWHHCVGSIEKEMHANARLIAAAPELLDACMAMLEWDDREQDHAVDFNARMELCRAAFNKARAAIAKATEEQQ